MLRPRGISNDVLRDFWEFREISPAGVWRPRSKPKVPPKTIWLEVDFLNIDAPTSRSINNSAICATRCCHAGRVFRPSGRSNISLAKPFDELHQRLGKACFWNVVGNWGKTIAKTLFGRSRTRPEFVTANTSNDACRGKFHCIPHSAVSI